VERLDYEPDAGSAYQPPGVRVKMSARNISTEIFQFVLYFLKYFSGKKQKKTKEH